MTEAWITAHSYIPVAGLSQSEGPPLEVEPGIGALTLGVFLRETCERFGPREACDGVGIVRIHAHVAPHRGRARIAWSDDHLGAREGERTGEGVLTGTGADDEDLHGHQAYRGCIKARPPPSSGASLLGRFLVRALRQRDHVEVDANSTSILGPL